MRKKELKKIIKEVNENVKIEVNENVKIVLTN